MISSILFACIEKPGIDARSVYKNKFEIAKIDKERLDWLKNHGPQIFSRVNGGSSMVPQSDKDKKVD